PGMLHHFASKETLLGAVIDRLEAHAQGLLDSIEVLQSSPQSLVAALAGPWDPREHSMALLATLSAEVVNPDHPGRFRIARLRLVHEHVLEQVLRGLDANGRLVPGSDPKFLARTLFSLLLSLTVREHTVLELQTTADGAPISGVQAFVRQVVADWGPVGGGRATGPGPSVGGARHRRSARPAGRALPAPVAPVRALSVDSQVV